MKTHNTFMENNTILLINKEKIEKIYIGQATVDAIGGKALGLCKIPQAWSVPFFVISKELFWEYVSNNTESIVDEYIPNILFALDNLKIRENVILRSSAVNEGMIERGRFESVNTTVKEIKSGLVQLLNKLKDIPNDGMPIIVQTYVSPIFTGHMSNERRFSQDSRDWKIEMYYNDNSFEQDTIGVRAWRTTYHLEEIICQPLCCTNKRVSIELQKVAYYWYDLSKKSKHRFHLEFLFDGTKIIIVQADCDNSKIDSVNPKSYNTKINSPHASWEPRVLKKYDPNSEVQFKKLKNVKTYYELGFCTVPLYYLNDKKIISDLSKGVVEESLSEDLKTLLSIQPLVIRMDIDSDDKSERQMLPRSNEIMDYFSVVSWLKDNSNKLQDYKNVVFIFHNFVPATSAAFAHALPNGRLVKIQSLWGLPEGLYYNSHDTIIVDLGSKDLDSISDSDVKVTVKNKFKDQFITPGNDGKWVAKTTKEPYDWNCSIENNSSILDIAIKSQKLSNLEQKEISVMWFIGIDASYYGADNLPWFHEEVNISSYTTDNFKRKYFSEEEFIINSSEDFEKLSKSEFVNTIKCIRLKPNCEKDLRNKELISTIGSFAAQNDIMILLDGTQLTHSYYQLKNTGAKVVCSEKDELLYSDTLEFNKLVRDKIPEKIISNGEHVNCFYITGHLLDRMLLEKLIEESYELSDSETKDEMISELADLIEVCETLLNRNSITPISTLDILDNTKHFYFDNFVDIKTIRFPERSNTYFKTFKNGDLFCSVKIERQKTVYRFEFNVQNKPFYNSKKQIFFCDPKLEAVKKRVIKLASLAIKEKKSTKTVYFINEILKIVDEFCSLLGISKADVIQKREKKLKKNGGFERGYILKQTFLSDNIIDEKLLFDPQNCEEQFEVERDLSKNFELLQDFKNNNSRLLFRFSMPIAINNWETTFENIKIGILFNNTQKIRFRATKKCSGNIFMTIGFLNSPKNEQLTLFEI